MRRLALVLVAACGHGGGAPAAPRAAAIDAEAGLAPPADAAADPALDASPDAAPAAPKPRPPKAPPKVVQLNEPGALVDVAAAAPAGYVTIVDFWATWCGGCKVIEEKFMAAIKDQPRVVVRKVDVGDGDTPVAKHYGVHGLPQVWIYDGKQRLRYVLVANDALETGAKAISLTAEK